MKFLDGANRFLGKKLIPDFEKKDDRFVRIKSGMIAGWVSIVVTAVLFAAKMVLGLLAGSVAVMADAFHLLSHLANSIILVLSYWLISHPATEKTPFGQGRMEHVAPFVMSVFLFVSGIQIGGKALHQVVEPRPIHYWPALPRLLAATVILRELLSQFVRFLGSRVRSHAILTNAFHHRIEGIISLTVIAGLMAGNYLHLPALDGIIGVIVSLWLLYLGYSHGRQAIIPILGQAPARQLTEEIRDFSRAVEGVEDVHEIIVHDYGSKYMLSLLVEVPEKLGTAEIHQIVERCEEKLRRRYGGEVVCHSDPLVEKTAEIQAIEDRFNKIVEGSPQVAGYHGFRVITHSPE